MRIGIITTHPPGKGSLNEYAYHFVRYLRQKDFVEEIILFVDHITDGSYEFAQEPDLVPVKAIPCWTFDKWDNVFSIYKAVKKEKPDVVLYNIQFASFSGNQIPAALGLLSPLTLRLSGIPSIVLLHNILETVDLDSAGFGENPIKAFLIHFFGNIITRLILAADLVALTIPKYVEILEEKYHCKNVILAPHGSFEDADESLEPDYQLPAGPYQIMTFGKFGTYKRVEVLIDAYQWLLENTSHELALVVAGSDNPNVKGYLAAAYEKCKHLPNVNFTGYVAEEDIPTLFHDAAAVVFPYTSTTGSSGVLHQAGAYGKAVVLPLLGDLKELIEEEGYMGEFFEPEDSVSLAKAIQKLLDDEAYRKEMGMRNYFAATGLAIRDIVDWYIFHFERLVNQKSK